MKADLIIYNIGVLATMRGEKRPRIKEEMNNIEILKNAYIVISGGIIVDFGEGDYKKSYVGSETRIHDALGMLVTPGLIDSHTHLVHGGSREHEFDMKIKGVSYIDILKQGGGILSTVNATKGASFDELYAKAMKSLNIMLSMGTTTVEAKSGYGLEIETEMKQLKVAKELNENHPVTVVSTFMPAHAVPIQYKGNSDEYVDIIINEMLQIVKDENLAVFCDVFCEDNVFSIDQTEKILSSAKKLGYKAKLHADEIKPIGGAELSARINAISADHLMAASEEGMKLMAKSGVIANLLPATSFSLMKNYADARKMIELGVAVSISTDYNPGSCPSENIQFAMQLGSLGLKMTPNEVLCAVTINAAYALDLGEYIGSIEIGKKADLVVFDVPNIEYLIYHFGINHVKNVYKDGRLVVENQTVIW